MHFPVTNAAAAAAVKKEGEAGPQRWREAPRTEALRVSPVGRLRASCGYTRNVSSEERREDQVRPENPARRS